MLVEYTCEDHVAMLTLNRPEKLNAFSDELVVALQEALPRFDADAEAWVAIIHGRGRAFSSGADVHQRQLRKREEFERLGGPQGFGAHAGDLLTKSTDKGGLDFGTIGSSLVLATILIVFITFTSARAKRAVPQP